MQDTASGKTATTRKRVLADLPPGRGAFLFGVGSAFVTTKREVLEALDVGERIAELETEHLASYFVETDQWSRILAGDIDVVYGPKGAGKSAIYSVLAARRDELFDRNILLATAENPTGAPAFKDLVDDPPTSEREFVALWKLYVAGLIGAELREYGVTNDAANRAFELLDSRVQGWFLPRRT